MSDELLPYYNRELSFLRRMGAEFADKHPKIAGRLRMTADAVEDPHVSRLIEAVAYLNARVRKKLDDEFPELTDALLSVLYPHYLAPVPSMAIAQFVGKRDLKNGHTIPAGSNVETLPVDGEPCRFRTGYPVTVWPIEIESAKLTGRPILAPQVPAFGGAVASLRMVLRCRTSDGTFAALAPGSLRFFLRGPLQISAQLYELLLNDTVGVALAGSPDDAQPQVLDKTCVVPVGFEADEGLLPYRPSSFLGYRLLTEFFAFPQKFLFFDLSALEGRLSRMGNRLEVYFYLRRTATELEQNVTKDSLALGCAPMVNYYAHRAEPVEVDHSQTEYRVVPDSRRPLSTEVYSIENVAGIAPDGSEIAFSPFYSVRHASRDASRTHFWHATRRPSLAIRGQPNSGTDVFLTLVDLDFKPSVPQDLILNIDTFCLNRDVPSRLPFGGDQPRIQLGGGGAPLEQMRCLTQPTPTLRPSLAEGHQWRLISHLSLNHMSLTGGEGGVDALRELLRLYDFRNSAETRATIDGISGVASREITARAPSRRRGGICRGTEVRVEFDAARLSANETFLFASVLERFFSMYCSVNSFTRTVAAVKGREGELRRWPPRAGDKVLL